MDKEQLFEKIEHIRKTVQTYPDDTEILSVSISSGIGKTDVHVANNMDKIAINNNLTMVVEPIEDTPGDWTKWYQHSIMNADGVCTLHLERHDSGGGEK